MECAECNTRGVPTSLHGCRAAVVGGSTGLGSGTCSAPPGQELLGWSWQPVHWEGAFYPNTQKKNCLRYRRIATLHFRFKNSQAPVNTRLLLMLRIWDFLIFFFYPSVCDITYCKGRYVCFYICSPSKMS